VALGLNHRLGIISNAKLRDASDDTGIELQLAELFLSPANS
jgi:hypothetical protein